MIQEFVQQIRDEIDSRAADIHTAIPARIVSYDSAKSQVTVKPYGVFMTGNKSLDYPLISGVPVVMPMAAGKSCGLAVPVVPGDDCLLIFAEQDISCWLDGADPDISMTHALSNAVAICGLSSKQNAAANKATQDSIMRLYNSGTTIDLKQDSVVISQGSSRICVSDGRITIEGAVSVSGNLSVSGSITYGGTCEKG